MIEVIDAWLRLAADRLHEQAAALTALDQAIGDGDHGTNMDRGFSAIRALDRRRSTRRGRAAGRGRGAAEDGRADAHQHRRRGGRAAVWHRADAGRWDGGGFVAGTAPAR